MNKLFPSIPDADNSAIKEEKAPVFESIEYKISQIVEKIKNIDQLNENEIKHIIVRQHTMILNYDLFLANERKYALELFTNKRFLKILLDIIGTIDLSNHEIVCINKLAYDYYVSKNKDKEVSDLLMELSYFINNKTAIRLSAIYGIKGGRILAMISKSAFNPDKNINRVNRFIVKSNISLSVKDIIDTYCILYNHFTDPIIYTMLEVRPVGLSTVENDRFTAISKAMMILLNSMTSSDIHKVLSNYIYVLQLSNTNITRFSIKDTAIKGNLDRIANIISQLEFEIEDIPKCL